MYNIVIVYSCFGHLARNIIYIHNDNRPEGRLVFLCRRLPRQDGMTDQILITLADHRQ